MIVEGVHITHFQSGFRFVEVDHDRIVVRGDHPEHIVAIDVYVVVMDLVKGGEGACRSNRTGVEIKSNKDLRASMHAAVCTDEFALAKAHIRSKRQSHRFACIGVRSRPLAMNIGQAHEAIEICNLRRIVDIGQRDSRI